LFTPYRRILTVPGAIAFSGAGLLARLPIAMTGLGIVLLVSVRTGSYGTAGVVSAVHIVAAAAFQPVLGRLVDRLGQARVVLPSLALFVVGMVVLCLGVELEWSRVTWYLGAALAGASFPPWGSLVRARWAYVLRDNRRLLPTAFAFEAVVDEVIFMTGPVLVTLLVTVLHPVAGLGAAGLLGVIGGLLLAAQRATAPPANRPEPDAPVVARPPLGWRVLLPLAVASIGLGALFGGAEVATVAFADEAGNRGDAGWMLAVWAVGSLLSGVVVGSLRPGLVLWQFRLGAVALTLTMATTTLAGSPWVLAALLFCSGSAISPTMIAAVGLVEQTVPATRLTEGMTWMTTGLAVGIAPGAAVTGAVVDASGASTSFWVPVVGGATAAVLAWTIRPASARRIGTPGVADQTDPESSARLSADSGRRRDA